jgi:GxxExxY protein
MNLSGQITEARDEFRAPLSFNRQEARNAKIFMKTPSNIAMIIRAEPSKEVDDLARKVIGAAIEVHRALGPGYTENVYEEALCIEIRNQKIPFERQVKIAVEYKGQKVGEGRLDLLVAKLLPVELKAVEGFAPIQQAQVLSYLKMTRLQLGLLINFNIPILKQGIKRIIFTQS